MKCLVCHRGHVTHIIMSNIIMEGLFLPNHRGNISTLQALEMTLYCFSVPDACFIVSSAGTHHSMVHRLSVSHPGVIPGVLCGKGVKWGVWDLCWCTVVGTGKTKLSEKQFKHSLAQAMSLKPSGDFDYCFTRSLSPPLVTVTRFPRPGMDACWQPHSAWSAWPSLLFLQ